MLNLNKEQIEFVWYVLIFSLLIGVVIGWSACAFSQKPVKQTYDQQHTAAYDFMAKNPHVRAEVCSKRFVIIPMDSKGE